MRREFEFWTDTETQARLAAGAIYGLGALERAMAASFRDHLLPAKERLRLLEVKGVLTGAEIRSMRPEAFGARAQDTTIFARVDPDRPCVLRATERELVPNRGAQLGNFGTVNASRQESWVITSEGMQGDAKKPMDLELTARRGANARVYLARLV